MEDEIPEGYKYCECGKCKELVPETDMYNRPVRFAVGHNSRGAGNSQYKGGKRKYKEFKYKSKKDPSHPNADVRGNIRVHVWVYTTYHKCCMLPWGQVHHIDGDTMNNDISNLEGMMRSAHRRNHMTADMSDRICSMCKAEESHKRHWYKHEGKWICKSCKDKLRWQNRVKIPIGGA